MLDGPGITLGTVGPVMFWKLIGIDPLRLFTWCALCGAIMIIPGPVELLRGAAAQAWDTQQAARPLTSVPATHVRERRCPGRPTRRDPSRSRAPLTGKNNS